MRRAVEVSQTVSQVYVELGVTADVERAVVGEVAGGGKVKAAGDGKGAIVGGEMGQAISRTSLILNLRRCTRHSYAGVGGNRLDVSALELQCATIDVGAAC